MELHERGITWLAGIQRSTEDYAEIIATNWVAPPPAKGNLSLKIVWVHDSAQKVIRVNVPMKCQAAVDEVLTAKLGKRHVPGD
ncbi:MAG: hypothetical protein MPJ50_02420 [Pirellulales bacterium]|nr:hypothetical protein [Pirellulales bacterium]